jgi:hypothetical protein
MDEQIVCALFFPLTGSPLTGRLCTFQ